MKMPVIFVGHGSPMNAITDNIFKDAWIDLGKRIKPKAILAISAHWFTNESLVNPQDEPEQIFDMYGFPPELYQVNYKPSGSFWIANEVKSLLGDKVKDNINWGIDHGTWSVLKWMFSDADIPTMQLSIDASLSEKEYFEMGQKLSVLREEGVLILGSGNVVHNLQLVDWNSQGGFDWAIDFDKKMKEAIEARTFDQVLDYKSFGEIAKLAVPTKDHFVPLLYVLGAASADDSLEIFNEDYELGSMSMTGYAFGMPSSSN